MISGDFFLEPAGALLAINSQLVGMPAATPVAKPAAVVSRAAGADALLIGFSPEVVAIAVRRALGHATSWHDHTFELIHDEPREPHLQMALDEVLAQEVGAGRAVREAELDAARALAAEKFATEAWINLVP